MRLTCPNCGAQYEVPEDVIPTEGRDVQCSSCGNTWFQAHADQAIAQEDDPNLPAGDPEWTPEVDTAPISDDTPETVTAEAEEPAADPTPDDTITAAPDATDAALAAAVRAAVSRARSDREAAPVTIDLDEDAAEDVTVNQEPELPDFEAGLDADLEALEDDAPAENADEAPAARRELDPSVADVLREEAALEAARRAEETNLESQPDLGLTEPTDDAAIRARQARERMARMRGVSVEDVDKPAPPIPANSRRDLLPDIDEINSTLRATEDRSVEEQPDGRPTVSQRRARGSRIGFALAILLVAAGIFIYTQPSKVSDTLPQAEPYVSAYVNAVNSARIELDVQVTKLMLWLDTMSSADVESDA